MLLHTATSHRTPRVRINHSYPCQTLSRHCIDYSTNPPVARRSWVSNKKVSTWPKSNLAPQSGVHFGRSPTLLPKVGTTLVKIDLAEFRLFFSKFNLAPESREHFGQTPTLLPEVGSTSQRIDFTDFQCFAVQTRCPWVRILWQAILCKCAFGSQTRANGRKRSQMVAHAWKQSCVLKRTSAHQWTWQNLAVPSRCPWVRILWQVILCTCAFWLQTRANGCTRVETVLCHQTNECTPMDLAKSDWQSHVSGLSPRPVLVDLSTR